MLKSIKEVKCKKCGSSNFGLSVLYQNVRTYKVLSNGKFSKKCTLEKDLLMEVEALICLNCGEQISYWDTDKDGYVEVDE